jgi:hypothetical protein
VCSSTTDLFDNFLLEKPIAAENLWGFHGDYSSGDVVSVELGAHNLLSVSRSFASQLQETVFLVRKQAAFCNASSDYYILG